MFLQPIQAHSSVYFFEWGESILQNINTFFFFCVFSPLFEQLPSQSLYCKHIKHIISTPLLLKHPSNLSSIMRNRSCFWKLLISIFVLRFVARRQFFSKSLDAFYSSPNSSFKHLLHNHIFFSVMFVEKYLIRIIVTVSPPNFFVSHL